MDNSLIEIENVSLLRNDKSVLKNISFEIKKSQALNLYGLNGSGKTSLLKIIIGMTEPTSGFIKNVSGDEDLFKKTIYIGHKYGIKGNLTVKENLSYALTDNSDNSQLIIKTALETYKMTQHKSMLTKNLSHGQQKKVSLMKTLITNSLLWVIDEPYSALDDESINIFNNTAKAYLEKGGALIMTSHKEIKESFFTTKNYKIYS
ncbi:MAG: heme exporter protein A [Gammaproteobacteria bacterium]|jgi:heme exporter protein A|tara:strand:- start:554 stop:1165 length:612 start_codon:yes stop_codon:yes gene_type:complete